ncbi:glycoside hydrolase family 26 protein [Variovorax sp. HJSM1_2]|uniref:glycoside hydrolase family 26 protein n=1 Tax=Variovorax sp. HJSM1_2 TaxID=3366263 RepID=UPI003BC75051
MHKYRVSFLACLLLAGSAGAMPAAPLGMYLGPGCVGVKRVESFGKWLGRKPERASDFFSDHSWLEMAKAAERSTRCWTPTGFAMSFALPMLPRDKSSTLARGAAGEYDQHFVKIAEILVRNGQANAVVRVGWEFNNTWFVWRADTDPVAWVAYWRRIVTAMRSVAGANFKFDWCTAWSEGKIAPTEVYPGDAYVDIIGMDVYNTSWNPRTPQERWLLKLNAPYGLKWQKEFAAARGKPVSFPEWGTGTRPDGRGGGDDPYYVRKMAEWIASSNVAYHNYWDFPAPDFNAILSDGSKPEAAAAFLETFGGPR